MARSFHTLLDFSQKSRVFVVGDIHGEYGKLDDGLNKLGFSPRNDVLISIGDLVDRGPISEDFEWWIQQSWFYRVLGNHDTQPREYLLGYESKEAVDGNGGEWLTSKPTEEIERIASLLEDAALAFTIFTPARNRVGITHADVHCRWDQLLEKINDPSLERYHVNMLTASRDIINAVKKNPHIDPEKIRVQGIDHVFHGHTPVDEPLTVANRTWIDTDKGPDGGNLSIIDVDDFLKR